MVDVGDVTPHHDEDPEVSSLPRREGWLSFADVILTCRACHTVPTTTGLFNSKAIEPGTRTRIPRYDDQDNVDLLSDLSG